MELLVQIDLGSGVEVGDHGLDDCQNVNGCPPSCWSHQGSVADPRPLVWIYLVLIVLDYSGHTRTCGLPSGIADTDNHNRMCSNNSRKLLLFHSWRTTASFSFRLLLSVC